MVPRKSAIRGMFRPLKNKGFRVGPDHLHARFSMSSVPVNPEIQSSTLEELLERVRDGLLAEEELIGRYLEIYGHKDSTALLMLKAMFRSAAEKAGTDVLSLVGMLLVERREEIARLLEDFSTPTTYEAGVLRKVRREIWKHCKWQQRGPSSGDPRVEEAQEKGYRPGSNGQPHSTILLETRDESLEAAIDRVQGKTEHQRRLNEVLARLHILKGWEYEKLARLVFGPGQDEDKLADNGDRIRKWIQEPIRYIRAEKKRNQEERKKKRRDATGHEDDGGLANDRDSTGDDRL